MENYLPPISNFALQTELVLDCIALIAVKQDANEELRHGAFDDSINALQGSAAICPGFWLGFEGTILFPLPPPIEKIWHNIVTGALVPKAQDLESTVNAQTVDNIKIHMESFLKARQIRATKGFANRLQLLAKFPFMTIEAGERISAIYTPSQATLEGRSFKYDQHLAKNTCLEV